MGRLTTVPLPTPTQSTESVAAQPAAPAVTEAPPARKSKKVKAKRRRSWTVMLVPPTGGSVRSYEIRRWQLRLAAVFGVVLIVASLAGGTALGIHWREEEIADIDAVLWDTQLSVTALNDTLQAMRLAASITPSGSPALAARPNTAPTRARSAGATLSRTPSPGVVLPVYGRIASVFSRSRLHPILRIRRPHLGLDISAPGGTRIRAPAAGRVARVEREFGFGLVVEVDHGKGVISRYAHCRAALVNVGDPVEAGTEIATVGSSGLATGPHLHYEVLVNHRQVDPLHFVVPGPNDAASPTQGLVAGQAGSLATEASAAGHTTQRP